MPPTFIFIRHGSISIQAPPAARLPPLARRGLTVQGEQEARAAGVFLRRWLSDHGLTPTRLLLADSERARQTAALALPVAVPAQTCAMRAREPLRQLDAWLADDAVVCRVGHGPPFISTLQALYPDAPDYSRVFGAVLIAVRDPTWRLAALHPATAPPPA
jgi:phosphohistidine phosphatase SixA